MKVLFIASWYPNGTDPLKGIFVKKHAEAIKKADVEIEVLAITVSNSTKFYEKKITKTRDEAGIVTHLIELNSKFYKFIHVDLFLQFGVMKNYYDKIVKPTFKPDIIHSNVLFPAAILGYKLAGKEKLPHVITEHWSKVDKFFSKSLYSGIGKKAYSSANYVTVVSDFLKRSLSKHFTDPSKIKVVPNVIDTSVFSFREKSSGGKIIFCCVAHWNGVKRPDLIFNSLNEFSKKSSRPVQLKVVGEGILLEQLKNNKWDFETSYLGNLNRNDLASVLHSADYFLHASETETFSIVIAEALATGTPVLASNVGAIPELINKENGFLCNNTINSWSECLMKLTATEFDNKKIAEQAHNFGLEKIGNKFLDLYRSI
jgi:glycosyltransferase involved in cell wall biosynthesis